MLVQSKGERKSDQSKVLKGGQEAGFARQDNRMGHCDRRHCVSLRFRRRLYRRAAIGRALSCRYS